MSSSAPSAAAAADAKPAAASASAAPIENNKPAKEGLDAPSKEVKSEITQDGMRIESNWSEDTHSCSPHSPNARAIWSAEAQRCERTARARTTNRQREEHTAKRMRAFAHDTRSSCRAVLASPVLSSLAPAVHRDQVVTSFDDMNLKDELLRGIYAYGFEKPSAIQQRGIMPVLAGHDTIAQAQSGTGKTATFSIAVLQQIDLKQNKWFVDNAENTSRAEQGPMSAMLTLALPCVVSSCAAKP